jgi:hypothetical protein
MSTYKRSDGDYYIVTVNSDDNVHIQTNTVKIQGNLDVVGNITYIDTTELEITDPFITLAANNTGGYSNIGILAQKGSNLFAGLRWNSASATWQTSPNNTTWADIATGNVVSTAAGSNTQIQFNDNNSFGANVKLTYDYATSKLTIQGHQIYGNIGTSPSSVANSVAVYNKAEGGGGTGLYVKSSTVDDELVSKGKAIVYAIIF